MEYSFSFSGDLYEKLIHKCDKCIPGIMKMILFYSGSNAEIMNIQKESGQETERGNDFGKYTDFIESEMEQVKTYKWLRRDEVPFENIVRKTKKKQLDIFDESNMPVLVIRIESGLKKLGNVLFIFMDENASANFTMAKDPVPYSKQTKEFLGYFLYRIINQDLNILREDQQTYRRLLEKFERIRSAKTAATPKPDAYLTFFKDLCNYILSEVASGCFKPVTIEDEVYSFLLENLKGIKEIKHVLTEAFTFNEETSIMDEIVITLADIMAAMNDKPFPAFDETSLEKAKEYLDLFEGFAQQAPKNQIISIQYIIIMWGKKSLAAVSVAINTRKPAVRKLLELYPEKWTRIRAELAPVRSIDREIQKKMISKTA